MAVTFDTLELAKKLEAAGFTEAQAEGLSSAWSQIQAAQIEKLATRDDVRALRVELEAHRVATKQDLKQLATELRGELRLLRWMLGFVLAGILSMFIGVASLILEAFF